MPRFLVYLKHATLPSTPATPPSEIVTSASVLVRLCFVTDA